MHPESGHEAQPFPALGAAQRQSAPLTPVGMAFRYMRPQPVVLVIRNGALGARVLFDLVEALHMFLKIVNKRKGTLADRTCVESLVGSVELTVVVHLLVTVEMRLSCEGLRALITFKWSFT